MRIRVQDCQHVAAACAHPVVWTCFPPTFGDFRMARAMAMRCFWPPLTCAPASPAKVLYLCEEQWLRPSFAIQ